MDSVRVDVWLWSVRQIKTRSLATAECRAGHVQVNGERAKPAAPVRVGDEVRYRFQGFDRILEVTALLKKRVSAPQAQQCYIDHSPPRPAAMVPLVVRDRGAGRPTKKDRRALEQLMGTDFQHRSSRRRG